MTSPLPLAMKSLLWWCVYWHSGQDNLSLIWDQYQTTIILSIPDGQNQVQLFIYSCSRSLIYVITTSVSFHQDFMHFGIIFGDNAVHALLPPTGALKSTEWLNIFKFCDNFTFHCPGPLLKWLCTNELKVWFSSLCFNFHLCAFSLVHISVFSSNSKLCWFDWRTRD